jgi:predicted ABC-type ATPase
MYDTHVQYKLHLKTKVHLQLVSIIKKFLQKCNRKKSYKNSSLKKLQNVIELQNVTKMCVHNIPRLDYVHLLPIFL